MKLYLIISPEGQIHSPLRSNGGGALYRRKHAAIARCPKGYTVREYGIVAAEGVVVFSG